MTERANDMDELDIAEAMAKGELPSPQRYGSFYLFAIRITGTGLAYREGRKEYAWRDAGDYLNDRFVKRCSGLPVIWDHPKEKPALDSDEFNDRIVGTVFLPFVKDQDVWAIVKIYDAAATEMMLDEKLSTSPAVVFRESTSTNRTVKLDNGETLLVEGKPALLDHIAICERGVWDKGGEPSGVDATGVLMADEEKDKAAADKARHDAEESDAKMDAILDSFKRMDARMDAWEKDKKDSARRDAARKDKFGPRKDGESYKDWGKRHDEDMANMADALRKDSEEKEEDCMDAARRARHDAEEDEKRHDKDFEKWAKEEEKEPEHKDSKKDSEEAKEKEEREDKARKDAEEEKENEKLEREDKARKDSADKENAELRLRLKALEGLVKGITAETPAAERDALAAAQTRADAVAAMFGDRAPPAVAGEASLDYRRRLLGRFKRHSPGFKDSRFDGHDSATLGLIEDQVYRDAVANARSPGDVTPGLLVPYEERDRAGRVITRYHGDVGAFLAPFVPTDSMHVKLNRPQRGGMF